MLFRSDECPASGFDVFSGCMLSEASADGAEGSEAVSAGAEGLPAAEHAASESEAAAAAAARKLRKRRFICFIIGFSSLYVMMLPCAAAGRTDSVNFTIQIYRKTDENTSPVCRGRGELGVRSYGLYAGRRGGFCVSAAQFMGLFV